MKAQRIYTKNAQYQKFEVLKTNRNKRYKYNEFFVEGVRNINEAIRNGWHFHSFIYAYEKKLSGWAQDLLKTTETMINFELTEALMAELSGKTDTSELLAIVEMRDDAAESLPLSDNPLLVLFDRPSNKGNLGTLIRSCDALGADGLILTGHAVDLYDPETIAASMGSFFKVPVIRIADNQTIIQWMAQMKERYTGFKAVGTSAHAEKTIDQYDFTAPVMLMIGNETDGLSRNLQTLCDDMVTIPMSPDSSASSFNVACAATVMLYEATRQRRL